MIAPTRNLAPPRTPADFAARGVRERLPEVVHHTRSIPDVRRRDRLAEIVLGCLDQPVGPLAKAFDFRAQTKAAYRFMSRNAVRAPDVSRTRRARGPGPINDAPRCKGIILHDTVAVEPDGVVLGLVAQRSWARPPADRRPANVKPTTRQPKPIEDKESFKRIAGIRACRDPTADQPVENRSRWIHIMGREGDIHEVFEEILRPRDGLPTDGAVFRACRNRKVAGPYDRAFETPAAEPVKATTEIQVPVKSGSRKTRAVRVEIRALRAEPNPNRSKRPQRRTLTLNLLEIREIDSTKKNAKLWRIRTNEPVDSVSDVLRVAEIHTYLWRVEEVHPMTKSGMKVESLSGKHRRSPSRSGSGRFEEAEAGELGRYSSMRPTKYPARTSPAEVAEAFRIGSDTRTRVDRCIHKLGTPIPKRTCSKSQETRRPGACKRSAGSIRWRTGRSGRRFPHLWRHGSHGCGICRVVVRRPRPHWCFRRPRSRC